VRVCVGWGGAQAVVNDTTDGDVDLLRERIRALEAQLAQRGPCMGLEPGGEVFCPR
jgi:hypothetical protein